MFKNLISLFIVFHLVACGSGVKDQSEIEHIATQTKKQLSPKKRRTIIKYAKTIIETKLSQDGMKLQAFSLSLRAQGIIVIGADSDKSTFNIYRFNADPIKYEKTFYNVALTPGSSIGKITPLENGSFEIVAHKNGMSTKYIFNYFDGSLTKEGFNSDDAIRAFVENDGTIFVTSKYSLHGGGILAIGRNSSNGNYSVYRFDAATKKFEKAFQNVPIEKGSQIVYITPLEGGKFQITTKKNGITRNAIVNYFSGDFYYEDSVGVNVENRLKEIVENDGLRLQAYQYSLHHGGILAIGVDENLERYDFYRIDADSLRVEKVFEDVSLYDGEIVKSIRAMEKGRFLLETDFYGLKSKAIFDYFEGTLSYQ